MRGNGYYCDSFAAILFQEVNEDQLDSNSAYMLFYEREPLNSSRFMPNVKDREPDLTEIEDAAESDLRKMCVIQ